MLAGVCALVSIQVQAQDFGGKNGGDTQEKRFNLIADDLKDWLSRGGAQGLKLPPGLDQETYQSKMLEMISTNSVSFTRDTIVVNGAEKDCENIPASHLIRCNIDRFKNSTESDQYVIVHHEFAGLAGFETNEGQARSNYFISDQITSSLEKVTVLKLAVKNIVGPTSSFRDQFIQAKSLNLEDFLNHLDPVDSAKVYASWLCQGEDGKFSFWLSARRKDNTNVLYDPYRDHEYRYNARTGTIMIDKYNWILKKTADNRIILEGSSIVSERRKRKHPEYLRSVYYPERISGYSICTSK